MQRAILQSVRYHFFQGTPGLLTIHTKALVFKGVKLMVGGIRIKVTGVNNTHKSNFYEGLTYYELKFQKLD